MLQLSRSLRQAMKDKTLPMTCNARYIKNMDVCDCKYICKYKPPFQFSKHFLQKEELMSSASVPVLQ